MTIALSARARALLDPFLRKAKTSGDRSIALEAQRLTVLFAKSRKPMRAMKKERLAEKGARRASKKEETIAIRALVFERAQGECELLGAPYVTEELHHLENGIGRRRQLQAVENCMAVSRLAHRLYHDDPEQFRIAIETWCARHGYPLPSKFRRTA